MSEKCPKCDYKKLKAWDELSEDEKMIVRAKSQSTLEQRKKHRFCLRCGFEEIDEENLA